LLPDDQVHPDTHVLTMVNNVIGVVNYVIAARPSLLNFVIADSRIQPRASIRSPLLPPTQALQWRG
jgi:hypothetical protein